MKRANKQATEEDLAKFAEKFTKGFSTSKSVKVLWNGFREKCFVLWNGVRQRCIECIDTFVFFPNWRKHDLVTHGATVTSASQEGKKGALKKAHAIKKQPECHHYKKIQKEAQGACQSAHDDYINSMVSERGSNNTKLLPTSRM